MFAHSFCDFVLILFISFITRCSNCFLNSVFFPRIYTTSVHILLFDFCTHTRKKKTKCLQHENSLIIKFEIIWISVYHTCSTCSFPPTISIHIFLFMKMGNFKWTNIADKILCDRLLLIEQAKKKKIANHWVVSDSVNLSAAYISHVSIIVNCTFFLSLFSVVHFTKCTST